MSDLDFINKYIGIEFKVLFINLFLSQSQYAKENLE